MSNDPFYIDYLVGRRFPGLRHAKKAGDVEQVSQAEAYRRELLQMEHGDRQSLLSTERTKEAEEHRLRAEIEEKRRFWNSRAATSVDVTHWGRLAFWSLSEAVMLSLGRNPREVTAESLLPYASMSPFAALYRDTKEKVDRAYRARLVPDPVAPSEFLGWIPRLGIEPPTALVEEVRAFAGNIQDWQTVAGKHAQALGIVVAQVSDLNEQMRAKQAEIESMKSELEELRGWQFDESADTYPAHLDIAMQAWRAVTVKPGDGTPKQQLIAWLEGNYPKLTLEMRERIASVCNWSPTGGRPKGAVD